MNPDLHIVESLHLAVVAFDHELDLLVAPTERVGHEVQRGFLDLNAAAAGVAQRQQLLVHRDSHVPHDLAIVGVLVGVNVEKQTHDLRAARAKTDGFACLALGDAPDLRVIERPPPPPPAPPPPPPPPPP